MKYKNTEPPYFPQRLGAVWKWAVSDRIWGRRREAPARVAVPTRAPDLALIASGTPSLTWVGHATWLAVIGGARFVTDPNWSDKIGPFVERNAPPGIALDDAHPDVVLVSHNHRDHLDAPTIRRLGARPKYVVPEGLARTMRKLGADEVVELSWWASTEIAGARVTLVPSQHWSQRGLFDRNETLWGGFVVEAAGKGVYFAGDTAYFGGFREIGARFPSLDAALLPIGAYEPEWFMRRQHMNPEDAARAFVDLGAKLLCAMHWGTFKLTDEPLDEPPLALWQACQYLGIPEGKVWVPAIGETRAL